MLEHVLFLPPCSLLTVAAARLAPIVQTFGAGVGRPRAGDRGLLPVEYGRERRQHSTTAARERNRNSCPSRRRRVESLTGGVGKGVF